MAQSCDYELSEAAMRSDQGWLSHVTVNSQRQWQAELQVNEEQSFPTGEQVIRDGRVGSWVSL